MEPLWKWVIATVAFGFLALRLFVAAINYFSRPGLSRFKPVSDAVLPRISVLIPARNEAATLPGLLSQLISLPHPLHEVLVLNDASSDGTEEVVRQFMARSSMVRLLEGSALPGGWLGKAWACHQLAAEATGDYFLFLDADIAYLSPELLPRAVAAMQAGDLALLSIFPDQRMETLGERLTVPLMHYLLLSLLPLPWIYQLPFPSMAAANGQFMLFDGGRYRARPWHEQVRAIVVEDIAIMREVKASKQKGMTLLADGHIACRMYSSFRGAIAGFGKSLLSGFGDRIIGLVVFLALIFGIWVPLVGWLSWPGMAVALAMALLIRILISVSSRQPVGFSLMFHFAQMGTFLWISLFAIRRRISRTQQWKGRPVP